MSRWIAATLALALSAVFVPQEAPASTSDPLAVFRQAIAQFGPSTAHLHRPKHHAAKAVSAYAAAPTTVPSLRSEVNPLPPAPPPAPPITDRVEPDPTQPRAPRQFKSDDKTAVDAETKVVPEPRLRPEKPPLEVASLPPAAQDAGVPMNEGTLPALAALGADARPLDAIEEGPCTVLDPVAVASLGDGAIALTAKAVLDQRMAETVARWVRDDLEPAALSILDDRLTGLRVIDSYDCRGVNGIAGAKLSQHGFANAIDVAGFRIGDRWIAVGGDKKDAIDDARFLDAARYSACRRFMTVLGPGADVHHSNHFHLDLGPHGKTGTYKICW